MEKISCNYSIVNINGGILTNPKGKYLMEDDDELQEVIPGKQFVIFKEHHIIQTTAEELKTSYKSDWKTIFILF
jgi:hypothetical protein